jgi:hypothetical protein
MPFEWEPQIKQSKQPSVCAAQTFLSAAEWGGAIFKKTLDEFNRLANVHKLGFKLVESTTPPDPQGTRGVGADVLMDVSTGTHKFKFKTQAGPEHTGKLPATANDIHGATHPLRQGGAIIRAFVFVPATPRVGGSTSRVVSEDLRVYVALHELLHACGLDDTDPGHNPNNNPDIFMTGASVSSGSNPQNDRIDLGSRKFVPPHFLSTRTADLLRTNWQ